MSSKPNTSRDTEADVAFLTRALKAPTLREAVPRLAERARAENWTHEQFLVEARVRPFAEAPSRDDLVQQRGRRHSRPASAKLV